MEEEKKYNKEDFTQINKHKRKGLILKTPLNSGEMNIELSSWLNSRMPEMLWAVLIIRRFDRVGALEFFKSFAKSFSDLPDAERPDTLTISSISKMKPEKLDLILRTTLFQQSKEALRPLLLFPSLPGFEIWGKHLGSPTNDDWDIMASALAKVLDHQSEESTDCRWIKVWYMIVSGKLLYAPNLQESEQEVLLYPEYGNLRKVRPSIRASEIAFQDKKITDWAEDFWEVCFQETACIVPEELNLDDSKLSSNVIRQCVNSLKSHFLDYISKTSIDAKHDGAFGIVLYALEIFFEVFVAGEPSDRGVVSRVALRSIFECCILLEYLNGQSEDKWLQYRKYGAGQAKLAFLKLIDNSKETPYVNVETLKSLADEDLWIEFVDIDLGHWDRSNLRKMSESVGMKDEYDLYYDITSSFVHGNWSAVRDEVFTTCLNPLHRLHRVPKLRKTVRSSIATDGIRLINKMIETLDSIFPGVEGNLSYFISQLE